MLFVRLDLHICVSMALKGIIIRGDAPDQLESGVAHQLQLLLGVAPGYYRVQDQTIVPAEGFTRTVEQTEGLFFQLTPPADPLSGNISVLFLQGEDLAPFFRTGRFTTAMLESPAYTIQIGFRSDSVTEDLGECRLRLLPYAANKTKDLLIREISLLAAKIIGELNNHQRKSVHPLPVLTQEKPLRVKSSWRHKLEQLFTTYKWNIGIIDLPIQEIATGKGPFTVRWIQEAPGNDFKADPFGFNDGTNDILLFEYYHSRQRKGVIHLLDKTGERELLKNENHLSYPFVFEHRGLQIVMPESADDKRTAMYSFHEGKLVNHQFLFENEQVVDPTVFYFENRWWLFCTKKANQGADLRLYIFYSASPEGPWISHRSNPVKTDICTARPGGTPFLLDGKLIRPAQNSSRGYGAALMLMEITLLTPDDFQEQVFRQLQPHDFSGPYHEGIHTLSAWGNKTLVDGKRIRYTLQPFLRQFVK